MAQRNKAASELPVAREVVSHGLVIEMIGDLAYAIRSEAKPRIRYVLGQGVQASKRNTEIEKGIRGWVTRIEIPFRSPRVSDYVVYVIFLGEQVPFPFKLKHIEPRPD